MRTSIFNSLPLWHSRWSRRFDGLLRSDRGAVAFEFVIVVPMMLFILLGFTEMYLYMRAVSLVEHTAFTLADSIGQMPQVINDPSTSNSNNLGSLWSAAALLAAPNALQSQGGVIVTSICDLTATPCGVVAPLTQSMLPGVAKIYWQAQAPWTQSGMTSKITSTNILPSSWPFRNGDSAIVVEVFYKFTPFAMTANFWANAPGTQLIYERVYVRQRYGQALTLAAAQ